MNTTPAGCITITTKLDGKSIKESIKLLVLLLKRVEGKEVGEKDIEMEDIG